MWVMITVKLPVRPSPPAASIFWSVPWPDDKHAKEQIKIAKEEEEDDFDLESLKREMYFPYENKFDVFGRVPNWVGARKIVFKGSDIRIFPHEFTEVLPRNLRAFILGEGVDDSSHELVPDTVAEDNILRDIRTGDQRVLYDAALLDGCNHPQAVMTALGKDITIEDADFPAIGWYRCKPEYANYFFEPKELEEV